MLICSFCDKMNIVENWKTLFYSRYVEATMNIYIELCRNRRFVGRQKQEQESAPVPICTTSVLCISQRNTQAISVFYFHSAKTQLNFKMICMSPSTSFLHKPIFFVYLIYIQYTMLCLSLFYYHFPNLISFYSRMEYLVYLYQPVRRMLLVYNQKFGKFLYYIRPHNIHLPKPYK